MSARAQTRKQSFIIVNLLQLWREIQVETHALHGSPTADSQIDETSSSSSILNCYFLIFKQKIDLFDFMRPSDHTVLAFLSNCPVRRLTLKTEFRQMEMNVSDSLRHSGGARRNVEFLELLLPKH